MNVLVIGLGSMGKRRVRDLLALEAGTVAGFDPLEDRRQETRQRYLIDVYASLEEALRAHAPDAVAVSTPPDRHADHVVAAVGQGRHTFCELNLDASAVDAMIGAARERPDVVVAPSSSLRRHPAVRRIHDLLGSPSLGKPLVLTYHSGQWLPDWHPWEDYRSFFASRRATGACREILAVELSWLVWVFGDVAAVQASRAKVSSLEADIDDAYQVIVEFGSGLLGHMLVDAVARPAVRSLRLCAEGGTLEWEAYAPTLRRYDALAGSWHDELPRQAGLDGPDREAMYLDEMRDFVAACAGRAPYPYTLEEERAALGVLDAIDASAVDGRRVLLR